MLLQNGTVLTKLVFQSFLAVASGIFKECTQVVESLQHHATQGKEVVLGILKHALKTKIIYKKRRGSILPAHLIVIKKKKKKSIEKPFHAHVCYPADFRLLLCQQVLRPLDEH